METATTTTAKHQQHVAAPPRQPRARPRRLRPREVKESLILSAPPLGHVAGRRVHRRPPRSLIPRPGNRRANNTPHDSQRAPVTGGAAPPANLTNDVQVQRSRLVTDSQPGAVSICRRAAAQGIEDLIGRLDCTSPPCSSHMTCACKQQGLCLVSKNLSSNFTFHLLH